ncbi:MAG TPA: acyltransferase [Steroidobacteraceae bacterium]|jgi:peptidoglycan/LPS O-acetylase OafA/YrhL|nr:acyltransferase [Steroidobacteraceae bacterium]
MRSDRLPGLDLVRAVAIGWVMLYHASILWHVPGDSWIVRFGWMGVDLFFVLSGYLIAGQLLRPWARGATPHYSQFMTRRLLRTIPAYLVVLLLYLLAPALRDGREMQPLWQFLTFTQNLALDPTPRKVFSHAWSLCVEEQFYLLFPLIVMLLATRPSTRKIVGAVAVVLLFGIFIRGYLWWHDVSEMQDGARIVESARFMSLIYYPTWSRLDGLLAGVVAAMIQTFRPRWWQRLTARANLLLMCGVTGIASSMAFFGDQIAGLVPTLFGYPLLACSAALIVVGASDARSLIGRRALPGAGALASIAYSLYLTHKMVFNAIQEIGRRGPIGLQPFELACALLVALLAGTGLYWLVERPFLKLRDRLPGSRAIALTVKAHS